MRCIVCEKMCDRVVLDLGKIRPSAFLRPDEPSPEPASLCLVQCDCGMVQLDSFVNPDSMFRKYWYKSGVNAGMVRSLQNVVDGVCERVDLMPGDTVIDIGCNDGTMLSLYQRPGLYKVGYDPARNLQADAEIRCDLFVNDYFRGDYHKAKVITAIAMFYDLANPHLFLNQVRESLTDDGLFVLQMTDLTAMMRAVAFDNVCHEHVAYYPLHVLCDLLEWHGLAVTDVERNAVNGGSVRVYAAKKFGSRRATVEKEIAEERKFLRSEKGSFRTFRRTIEESLIGTLEAIDGVISRGGSVAVLGASTKGNTLLQYFGIGRDRIVRAVDANPDKHGLEMTAGRIPIVGEGHADPDLYLVLPWHFREGMIGKYDGFLGRGGRLLFPLPVPEVVSRG